MSATSSASCIKSVDCMQWCQSILAGGLDGKASWKTRIEQDDNYQSVLAHAIRTLFAKANKGTKAKIEDRLTKYDRAIKTASTIVKGLPACAKTVAEFSTEAKKTPQQG